MATIPEALAAARQYHQAGHLREAEQIFRQIVAVEPNCAEAWHSLGALCLAQGKLDEAAACDQRVRQSPTGSSSATLFQADMCNDRGISFAQQGHLDEAVANFQQAIQIHPDHSGAHNNLGIVLAQCGHYKEAVKHYEAALRVRPDFYEAYNNLGNALRDLGRIDEAIPQYEQAVHLKPDFAEAYNNHGIALVRHDQLEEAAAMFRKTIELKPNYVKAHSNLGNVVRDLGQFDEALRCYDHALRLQPEYPDAYRNRAMVHLVLGNFEQGWRDYEWRWKCQDVPARPFPQPMWDGSALSGKTILLHAEQGLGDALQFVRYAPLVKERGGHVVVECQEPLARLLDTCPGIDRTVSRGQPLPDFAVHAPLLSLPAIFGTTLATLPAAVPYLFADPELVRSWKAALDKETRRQGDKETGRQGDKETRRQGDKETGQISSDVAASHHSPLTTHHSPLRVGIAWQGNPVHPDDRRRSIPLAKFGPIAGIEGVRLFSLQKGLGVEQIEKVARQFTITDLSDRLVTFMDTAAVMKNLDLVITIDSAIAHAAGAIAVPVWVLVQLAPDWRWLVDREDSPWYPTMRLFRQRRWADWDEVIERISQELHRFKRMNRDT